MPDQTPPPTGSKRCPKCNHEVGELQQQCKCGYNLITGQQASTPKSSRLNFLKSLFNKRQQQIPSSSQQPQTPSSTSPTPPTSSPSTKCPKCGAGPFGSNDALQLHMNSSECLEKQQQKGGTDKLTSYFAGKGITKDTFSPKGIKNAITSSGAGVLTKALDKHGGAAVSQVKTNLKFAIYFPLAILSVFRLLIPTVEGYTGIAITPAFIEPFLLWKTLPVILAGLFGVALPPSVILGKSGVSFAFLNQICLFSIAGSAAVWGGNNILLPAVKTFMPEEYAIMMCFIKYRGSMQICVAQNQTVQYQKEGSYETLKMDLGAVTPSQTIPPPNPVPDTWSSSYPYDLPFTLSNENAVGTTYDISIPKNGIIVSASPYDDGRDSKPAAIISDMPNYPINPGGSVVVTAKFEEPFYQRGLENCKQYTYFKINISTEQIGGGSSKFGIIESDDGYDNQNFMYFFNPDVKTEPGPLDIYTYTLPFVVAYSQAKKIGPDKPHFGVYIKIKNKGGGTAFFDNITLIQTSDTNPFDISNCVLMENSLLFNHGINSNIYCPDGKNGNCIYITPIQRDNATLEKNKEWTFRCNGKIKDIDNPSNSFIGKVTGLMSVVANYEYLQKYDEQIACTKNEEFVYSLCIVLNETECSGASICHYCKECYGTKTAQNAYINQCVPVNTDCGYSCVESQCGADCTSGSNLPNTGCTQTRPYCTQDCRCFYPII